MGDGVTEGGEELEEQSCKCLRTERGKEKGRERDADEMRKKIGINYF